MASFEINPDLSEVLDRIRYGKRRRNCTAENDPTVLFLAGSAMASWLVATSHARQVVFIVGRAS